MAITVTARHNATSGTSAVQTLASSSTTPTANSLLLAFGGVQSNSHATAHSWQTPTGGGLTYTNIATSASFDWEASTDFDTSCTMYRAPVGGAPSAHTVTVDAWSGTQTGTYGVLCCDITGHNTTTPVLQSKIGGASVNPNSSSASGTVVFDNNLVVGSVIVVIVVGVASGNDTAGAYTSPTIGGQAMTQLFNQSGTFTHCGLWYRVITGAESNKTITFSDLGESIGNWAAVAVEIAAAASGTDLVVQDATSATSTDAIALTQTHNITVADATSATSVDNLVLTQTHVLAIADATQATSVDNLTLTRIIDLAIQKAVQATKSNNISLSQVHQLAIFDSVHATVADNLVLATGISLVIQKATQATSADGLVLVQTHSLQIQDATHATTADVVQLVGPGFGGFMTVSDVQLQKLQTITGKTGTINDLFHAYYGSLSGLVPATSYSVTDHQRVYWETQTAKSGISMADLEKEFYDAQLIAAGSLSDREFTYWTNL